MKRLYKAFTKKWALFCAGREFTDADLIYRSRILQDENFCRKEADRASIRFCSVFHSNLSGLTVKKGGDFTGNGWEECSFFKVFCQDLVMMADIYRGCIFGSASFCGFKMTEIHAEECNYTDTLFREGEIRNCTFKKCVFRGSAFWDVRLKGTVFSGCIFEDLKTEKIQCSDIILKDCVFYGYKTLKKEGCTFQNCLLNC